MKWNEKARAQIPESSLGEERAILLGYAMMTFSVLMYLLVGIVMVKPSLYRLVSRSSDRLLKYLNKKRMLSCCNFLFADLAIKTSVANNSTMK